jgi:hypothetical protein
MHAPSFRGRARRRETAGRAVDSRSVGETTRRHPTGASSSSRRAPARETRKHQRSDNPPRTGNRQVSYGEYENICDRAKTLLFRIGLGCIVAFWPARAVDKRPSTPPWLPSPHGWSPHPRSELLGRDAVGAELYRAPCFQTITCEEALRLNYHPLFSHALESELLCRASYKTRRAASISSHHPTTLYPHPPRLTHNMRFSVRVLALVALAASARAWVVRDTTCCGCIPPKC